MKNLIDLEERPARNVRAVGDVRTTRNVPSPSRTTVHVCAGDSARRSYLAQLLGAVRELTQTSSSSNEVDAVRRIRMEPADVAILDFRIDVCLSMLRSIVASGSRTRALVLLEEPALHLADEMFDAGAAGVLNSARLRGELGPAIQLISTGARLLPAGPRRFANSEANSLTNLSSADQQILRALARGLTNAQIGKYLYISEATVKAHLAHIMRQAGVGNRVQLAVAATRAGLLC